MIPLQDFVTESNRIEGINRPPTNPEIMAHANFLQLRTPISADLTHLVNTLQPGAVLRTDPDLNVRVGRYIAPPGGPDIEPALDHILKQARGVNGSPWSIHCDYELLHPFTDGNGRSGRALWLWMMYRRYPRHQHLSVGRSPRRGSGSRRRRRGRRGCGRGSCRDVSPAGPR